VTTALMKTIYSDPKLYPIALRVFTTLNAKISRHKITRPFARDHIRAFIKGGTAYALLLDPESFGDLASDLDIAVYIDPTLSANTFETLKRAVTTISLQTISQFKRALDQMFFPASDTGAARNIACSDSFLETDSIALFKDRLETQFIETSFATPFADWRTRNAVSRKSFVLANSLSQPDHVVKIEVPHYECCETIPLRTTPIVASHNRSIRFNRTSIPPYAADSTESSTEKAHEYRQGAFDLIRLKFNFQKTEASITTPTPTPPSDEDDGIIRNKPKKIVTLPADLIDISISDRDDSELIDFWHREKLVNMNAQTSILVDVDIPDGSGQTVKIPRVSYLIDELGKMLYTYDCPESKRDRRQICYDRLLARANSEQSNVPIE
jgi:hypothetical protein